MGTPNVGGTATHNHKEAFCLMWYSCPCGHTERFWNSRDGVTPFVTLCPSCHRPTLQHVNFGSDRFEPNYEPVIGQRVWVSMTRKRAERVAAIRVAARAAHGSQIPSGMFESLVDHIYMGGEAPDLVVTGYVET